MFNDPIEIGAACEYGYHKGYNKGYEDGKRDAVVHARWGTRLCRCSKCGGEAVIGETSNKNGSVYIDVIKSDFCPWCGAKMDLKEGDE